MSATKVAGLCFVQANINNTSNIPTGNNNLLETIPAEWRPSKTSYLLCQTLNGPGYGMTCSPDGSMSINNFGQVINGGSYIFVTGWWKL